MFDKLKNLEWLWSLGNLLWEQLVKWGVTAAALAMLTAAAAFFYSIAAWINSYKLAGWSAAAFATVLLTILVVGMVAWSVGQVRRLKNGNSPPNAPAAERAAAVNEGRKSAQLDQQMQALNRTAFLLSTAAVGEFYKRRLEDGLKWYKEHPRTLPFDNNESLLAEISRVQEFINDLQSNLAPSHWTGELYRVITAAEQEASYDEDKMVVPDGLNHFQYRRFYIACLQYDRVGQFLARSVEEAGSHERQMHQMVRDRPDLHK